MFRSSFHLRAVLACRPPRSCIQIRIIRYNLQISFLSENLRTRKDGAPLRSPPSCRRGDARVVSHTCVTPTPRQVTLVSRPLTSASSQCHARVMFVPRLRYARLTSASRPLHVRDTLVKSTARPRHARVIPASHSRHILIMLVSHSRHLRVTSASRSCHARVTFTSRPRHVRVTFRRDGGDAPPRLRWKSQFPRLAQNHTWVRLEVSSPPNAILSPAPTPAPSDSEGTSF
jgi:hypothetical protein